MPKANIEIQEHLLCIKEWFDALVSDEQKQILEHFEGSRFSLLFFIEKKYPQMLEAIQMVFEYVDGRLKDNKKEVVLQELDELEFQDSALRYHLLNNCLAYLEPYRDANALRSSSVEYFKLLITAIIRDMFVQREYSSISSLQKNVSHSEWGEEELEQSVQLIRGLFYSFYKQNSNFEDFSGFLQNGLGFDGQKVDAFINIFRMHREGIERYFLFENLSLIISSIEEVSAASNRSNE